MRSPKTEHHLAKVERTIPQFPELRDILKPAREKAGDAVYVVNELFC